ncbi:MAG: hypothetical protein U5K81_02120 [Trueperaceae bacterium]|nr:hypothetical protein [Trueperaceae bacterium]
MTHSLRRSTTYRVAAVGAALAAGLILPVLVHLIPVESGPPMGARLLPIFLAATLAAMRLDAVSALSIAVLTPLLNRLLTGMPAGPMLPALVIELVLVVSLVLAVRRWAPAALVAVAAPAYLIAAVVAGALVQGQGPAATLAFAFTASWPGLLILAAAGALAAPRGQGKAAA